MVTRRSLMRLFPAAVVVAVLDRFSRPVEATEATLSVVMASETLTEMETFHMANSYSVGNSYEFAITALMGQPAVTKLPDGRYAYTWTFGTERD